MESLRAPQTLPFDHEREKRLRNLTPRAEQVNYMSPAFRKEIMECAAASVPQFPPPKVLPCANVRPSTAFACDQPGSKICSSCRLVSYCSKECQTAHWKSHKHDCKTLLRSERWTPAWRAEKRQPEFIADNSEGANESRPQGEFDYGLPIWGNMPAMDVVNLGEDELLSNKNLKLAFIASGDLRNVVRTVNSFPLGYTGQLDILVNDRSPIIVSRNIVILLILATLPDEDIAVDTALHFWYSTFMPREYHIQISAAIVPLIQHFASSLLSASSPSGTPCVLSNQSTLQLHGHPYEIKPFLDQYVSTTRLSRSQAQLEYDRVRLAPSRRDYRDRMFAGLKLSHRVAFGAYRRYGIVAPFGAMKAHFDMPNASLFSLENKWMQTDYADPIRGWNLDEVWKSGKDHGAQTEDVYGCLYFHLSDQLRAFSRRLRTFSASFKFSILDACELASSIHAGSLSRVGIAKTIKFDRIEVSNILDPNYVGTRRVLEAWGPFLSHGKDATLIGSFMNWYAFQPGGRAANAPEGARDEAFKRIAELRKPFLKAVPQTLHSWELATYALVQSIDLAYDNSGEFAKFLQKQGLQAILKKVNLVLREKHRIVPHRLLVPVDASPSALPQVHDDETFYNYTSLTSFTWSERFVEFGRE